MTQRNLPIEDQYERLADIEIGDSIIWRGEHPNDGGDFKFGEKFFCFEIESDGKYIVTRVE